MHPKLKTLTQLTRIASNLKRRHKTIVFTNGCFDILHFGHVKYLEAAKKKGDILVIGLNSDASVRRIKGNTRPLNKETERAYILASLAFVDFVIIFKEETPRDLINSLKPDILVKGGDWKKEKIVGSGIVRKYGGKTLVIPFVKGFSTTGLIKKIAQKTPR